MTQSFFQPAAWPITAKVPALIVALMIAASGAITNQVLSRLIEIQQRHLKELTASYLDGLSSSLIPAVLRGDVWETFDILDRARTLYRDLKVTQTVVVNAEGVVLAASDPMQVPSYSRLPTTMTEPYHGDATLWLDERRKLGGSRRILIYQGLTIGGIYAEFDAAGIFRERVSVFWALVGTNVIIVLALAAIGYFSLRWTLRPVRIFMHFLQGAAGKPSLIPDYQVANERSEFSLLCQRYNALVRAMTEREAFAVQLAQHEKLSSLGRLASGMAHEINNPLDGLFNTIDILKRHGEDPLVRQRAISLLERGLSSIRDVVRATLITHRAEAPERPLKPVDVDDLELLIRPEAQRRELDIVWENRLTAEVASRSRAPSRAQSAAQCLQCEQGGACGFSPKIAKMHCQSQCVTKDPVPKLIEFAIWSHVTMTQHRVPNKAGSDCGSCGDSCPKSRVR